MRDAAVAKLNQYVQCVCVCVCVCVLGLFENGYSKADCDTVAATASSVCTSVSTSAYSFCGHYVPINILDI